MEIKKLIKDIKVLEFVNFKEDTFKLDIFNLCDNSKDLKKLKNSAFICVQGLNFDSHNLVSSLQNNGVKFFICSKKIETNLPYIIVENTREVLGELASNFYESPQKSFKLVSVIGTNGKTSTTYFIKALLNQLNIPCGIIGTSVVFIKNKKYAETLTTPDPLLLYSIFSKMKKAGCKVVVMEISAHAIKLNKVNNLVSDITIFTNFSQDHLDFFKTMENYKLTKFSYFNEFNTKKALINLDDSAGKELYLKIKDKICSKTYGINGKYDIFAKNIKYSLLNSTFLLNLSNKKYNINTKTIGNFNVYNILSSVLCLTELGYSFDVENCVNKLTNVSGRFNIFKLKNNRFIIIDYAHTPESLKLILQNTKNLSNLKLIAVFGCPGNRDEEKRELMGQIAYNYCEKIYITADNPKYENPLIICNEILRGAKEKGEIIIQREKAIKKAIKNLKENEVLLILGKATETYQDYNNLHIKYNDYEVLTKCIKNKKN